MKLKSYFSGTVEAAMELARQELGPDAMLVHSRRAMPEARHLGEYEVVFAVMPEAEQPPAAPSAPPVAESEPARSPVLDQMTQEVADLRRQIERIASVVGRSSALASAGEFASAALTEWFATLVATGVDVPAVEETMHRVKERHEGAETADRASLRAWLVDELARQIRVDASLGRASATRRVVVLVGPPGVGKTSVLVKLAVAQGLGARRPTLLVSLDNLRVGGAEQLRSFAAILGVSFESLECALSLPQTLSEHRNKDLVLIDTPGYGPKEMEEAAELAHAVAPVPDVDVHLVLSAAMNPADLARAVKRFEIFRPPKLVFTHLDETESYGAMWSEAARTGKAISFLAAGQQIPEDLEAATMDRIMNLVLGPPAERIRAAA
jgi:flagellar biosynthesis protein FlhF